MLDDEQDAIANLSNILENFVSNVTIVATYTNPALAIKELKDHDIDVLFLDVQMPTHNGFEVLKQLGHIDFQVVFVTAYERYALNAFKANAVDYILKPINTEDLKNTIATLRKMKSIGLLDEALNQRYNSSLRNFFTSLNNTNSFQETISLKSSDANITIVDTRDICRIISTSQGAVFHLANQKQILSGMTLAECENILNPSKFLRCHISHIVNKEHVSEINVKRTGTLTLKDGSKVPVSARRKQELLSHF